jgi:hypothetical protein
MNQKKINLEVYFSLFILIDMLFAIFSIEVHT